MDIRSYDSLSPSRSFQNKGTITAGFAGKDIPTIMGKVNVLTKEAIENSGIIQATSDVELESTEDKIKNQEIILSKSGKITAKSSEDIENLGLIESNQALSLASEDGSIENSGAIISDDGSIDLTAKTEIAHTKGIIKAKEDLNITAETEGITANSNIVSTNSDLQLTSHDGISSAGTLQAKGDITIVATDGSFHNDTGNVLTNDGTVNIRATSVKNDSTDPKNGYLQGDRLNVTAISGDIENTGVMYSKSSSAISAKNSVINSQNIELGDGSTITATDKDVTNTGLVLGARTLEISAADTISNSGEINAPQLTLKTAKLLDNKAGAGISSSSRVTMVNTKAITNDGLIDFGTMDATTGITSVTNSGTLKGHTLSISAPTFNNTGRTELSGGANLNVTNLTSKTLTAGGKSDITINGDYVNTGKLYIDGADLSITANSIINRSGAILKARSFTAKARSRGTFTNKGIIFGKNELIISAPTISNTRTGYLVSGTTLDLTATKTINDGGISSTQNMTIEGSLENSRDIRTQKTLSITGEVTNYGHLSGRDKVEITGKLDNKGSIASNTNITVSRGGSIYNSGVMTSYESMDLESSSLTNANTLEAVGTLSTTQSGNINNKSSIYGGTVNLKSTGGSITNESRIIARNRMDLYAAGDVINENQISLTGGGTMYITAGGDIRNERGHDITWVNDTNRLLFMPLSHSEIFVKREHGELPRDDRGRMQKFKKSTYHNKILYKDVVAKLSKQVPLITSGGDIKLTANKQVSSGLFNRGGNISSVGNISINATSIDNQDIDVMSREYITPKIVKNTATKKEDSGGDYYWRWWGDQTTYDIPYFQPKDILIPAPSIIQAGGTVSGSVSGIVSLNDSVMLGSRASGGGKPGILAPGGGRVGGSVNYSQVTTEPVKPVGSGASYVGKARSGARAPEVTDTTNGKFAPIKVESRQSLAELSKSRMQKLDITRGTTSGKLAQISLDDSSLSTLAGAIADTYTPPSMPKAPEISWEFDDPEIMKAVGADWTKSKSSGRYYIQETSPVFTDMGTYFSTDNFIKRIEGFEPKKHSVSSQKPERIHFGDSMKQMDFVRRQMTELTGHASLEDNVDYAQEIKNLYETGIKYGKEMKLSAGVALTEEQINALQDDMVWAEEIELRGTKIIVPRLYVAKSKREKRASGLLARNIDIEAGSIENNGSSIIGETVRLKSHTGDIINEDGGDIYASQHLTLDSARDIRNVGSSIESDGTGLITAERHIENITKSQRYGDEKNHVTTIGKQSTIKVRGPLALLSGGDLINKGSSIESGGLQFAVGGNMINESIEDSKSSEILFSGGHHKKKSVVYKPATITSTGDTEGFVAGNFALIGSRMSTSGDSTIKVGGDSLIISQVNSEMEDSYSESTTTGMFGGDKKHIDAHQSLTETLAGATITAGGKNVLINQGDQILQGATIHGGKGTFLKGRKTSMLATALRDMQSDFEYDEGMVFNTTDSTGHDNTFHVHSNITGGGEQIIDSDIIESDFTYKLKEIEPGIFSGSGLQNIVQALHTPKPYEEDKPSWAKKLEASGKSIKWNPVHNSTKSWDEHIEVLNPEFSAIVSLAAAVGTMYAGGFGLFAAEGAAAGAAAGTTAVTATTTMGTVMGQAALTGLASTGSVSLINNNFDLGKTASDLASPDSLYNFGLNTLTTGLTFGIGDKLGVGQIKAGMDVAQRA
ncbi:MAG: hypothetical protein AAF673_00720, partial [Pseudomonadota bacterium]